LPIVREECPVLVPPITFILPVAVSDIASAAMPR